MKIFFAILLIFLFSCTISVLDNNNDDFETKGKPDRPTGVDVEISEEMDKAIDFRLVSNKNILIKSINDKLILKIDSSESPFDRIIWYINGDQLPDSKIQIKIYGGDLIVGNHNISVIVIKDEKMGSIIFKFEVVE